MDELKEMLFEAVGRDIDLAEKTTDREFKTVCCNRIAALFDLIVFADLTEDFYAWTEQRIKKASRRSGGEA